ncbi:hypothetical protein, partial [Novipirellula maiorica]|uniref:hypothetical protein n=1 Tax=Novipirellula maiorica TaxID=1265734 RepID=UPI00059530B4
MVTTQRASWIAVDRKFCDFLYGVIPINAERSRGDGKSTYVKGAPPREHNRSGLVGPFSDHTARGG